MGLSSLCLTPITSFILEMDERSSGNGEEPQMIYSSKCDQTLGTPTFPRQS